MIKSLPPYDPLDKAVFEETQSVSYYSYARLLEDGPEAFTTLVDEIRRAEKTIDINIFSWADDSTGKKIAKEVRLAVKRNPKLRVTIRLDAIGCFFVGKKPKIWELIWVAPKFISVMGVRALLKFRKDTSSVFELPREVQKNLMNIFSDLLSQKRIIFRNRVLWRLARRRGISVTIENNPFWAMDHSKVFVFDNHRTMSGGMNIGDEYSGGWDGRQWGNVFSNHWKDYMVLTQRDPTALIFKKNHFPHLEFNPNRVQPIISLHRETYAENPELFSPLRVLHNKGGDDPGTRKQIRDAVFLLLRSAQKSIDIEHAYLMDQTIVDILIERATQGIQIRAIRSQPESAQFEAGNEYHFKQLVDIPGITIVRSARIMHTKLLIIDGVHAVIGSANFVTSSLQYHEENALFVIGDSPLKKQLEQAFEQSFTKSRQNLL